MVFLVFDVGGAGSCQAREIRSVWRSASPNISAAATATLIERKPSRIGMRTRASASAATAVRHAGAFAAEHQDVALAVVEAIGRLAGLAWSGAPGGGRLLAPPGVEMAVAVVLDEVGLIEIVEPAALQLARAKTAKPVGWITCTAHAEAGAQPEQGAGVLRRYRADRGRVSTGIVVSLRDGVKERWV